MAYEEDLYQLRDEAHLAPARDVPSRRKRGPLLAGVALAACALAGAAAYRGRPLLTGEALADTHGSSVVVHAYVDAL